MSENTTAPTIQISPENLLILLKNRFPLIFTEDKTNIRPLKIGIDRDIYTELEQQFSRKAIGRALEIYVKQPAYKEKLQLNAERIDLQNQVAGLVTEKHLQIAIEAAERAERRQQREQLRARQPAPEKNLPKKTKSPPPSQKTSYKERHKNTTPNPTNKKTAYHSPRQPIKKTPHSNEENSSVTNTQTTSSRTTPNPKPTIIIKKKRRLSPE